MITTPEEVRDWLRRGYEPLNDKNVMMPIADRISIQNELFQKSKGITTANNNYYQHCWDHKQHVCEECTKPLHEYKAEHISHILTRGAHRDMALDPRNSNILCETHHRQWETGKRECMRIFHKNQRIIETLTQEYQ